MSEPIISPWIIYLIDVAHAVESLAMAGATAAGVACVVLLFGVTFDSDDEFGALGRKYVKRVAAALAACLLVLLLAPSRAALVGMVVANEVTYERVEGAGELAGKAREAVRHDVLEIIEAVREADDE
jgi:hypothetical protein